MAGEHEYRTNILWVLFTDFTQTGDPVSPFERQVEQEQVRRFNCKMRQDLFTRLCGHHPVPCLPEGLSKSVLERHKIFGDQYRLPVGLQLNGPFGSFTIQRIYRQKSSSH